jgi:hypothetical protein
VIDDLPDGRIEVRPQFGADAGKNWRGRRNNIAANCAV